MPSTRVMARCDSRAVGRGATGATGASGRRTKCGRTSTTFTSASFGVNTSAGCTANTLSSIADGAAQLRRRSCRA